MEGKAKGATWQRFSRDIWRWGFLQMVDFVNFFPFSLHPPNALRLFLFTSDVVNIPRAVRGSNLPSLVHFCRLTCRFQLRYHFPQKADCL